MSDTTYPDAPADAEPPRRRRRLSYNPASETGRGAYSAARRHSRMVRALKFVLPALALLGFAVFWGTANFIPSEYADAVSISGIDIESNSVVMQEPHISGFEGTRRAYDVRAANAVQSLSDPKVITFNEIDATLGMAESGTASVTAPVGIYDGNHNTLRFNEGVQIATSQGHQARLTGAFIDLDAGSLTTDEPLEFTSDIAALRANAVSVEKNGKRVVFSGGISIAYRPNGDLMTAPAGDENP